VLVAIRTFLRFFMVFDYASLEFSNKIEITVKRLKAKHVIFFFKKVIIIVVYCMPFTYVSDKCS
jgi:hypothetical protein